MYSVNAVYVVTSFYPVCVFGAFGVFGVFGLICLFGVLGVCSACSVYSVRSVYSVCARCLRSIRYNGSSAGNVQLVGFMIVSRNKDRHHQMCLGWIKNA